MAAILDSLLAGMVVAVGAFALLLGVVVMGFGLARRRTAHERPAQSWANY